MRQMSRALALPRSLAAPSMNSCMARPTFHLFSSPLCLGKPSCGQKADVEKQQIYGPQHEASSIQSTITNLKELRHCQPISATETVLPSSDLRTKVHLTWPCPAKGAEASEQCYSGACMLLIWRARKQCCAGALERVRLFGRNSALKWAMLRQCTWASA